MLILDATAQAELVRNREASPLELVDAAIKRIESVNPQLNAVIWERFEKAREEARSSELPQGPFTGVPFLTKDLGCTTAGEPDSSGSRFLKRKRVHRRRDHRTCPADQGSRVYQSWPYEQSGIRLGSHH